MAEESPTSRFSGLRYATSLHSHTLIQFKDKGHDMRHIINEVVGAAFEDFTTMLEDRGRLCDAKDFRFNEMIIPDYTDPFIQAFYILRYFPAYLVEYYDIYKELLDIPKFTDPFHVISIGCGCGLDYYGLELALRDNDRSAADSVCYTGIDIVEWGYTNDFDNDDYEIMVQNILDFNRIGEIDENVDVIVFPKSIGEFSDGDFNRLLRLFRNSNFNEDELVIISSIRKQHTGIDTQRMTSLLNLMESKHNYVCRSPKDEYTYYRNPVGLRTHFYDFVYPQTVLDFLIDLQNKCPNMLENDEYCEDDCEDNLKKKWPILKTDHIRYQLFRLAR